MHTVDYEKQDQHFVLRFTAADRVTLSRLLGVRTVQEGGCLRWGDIARIMLKVQEELRGRKFPIDPDGG